MKSFLVFFAFFFVLEAVVVQVPLKKRPKLRQLVQHPKSRTVRPHTPGQFAFFAYTHDYFTTNITIGTPAKTFTVLVDQSDHQFFVLDASYNGERSGQHLYNTSESSTSKVIDDIYNAVYLGGNAEGYTVQDAFSLQGLTVAKQTFGSATYVVEEDAAGFPVDGVLGLTGSVFGYDSPLQNLAGQLDAPQYTIWIGPHVPLSQGTISGVLTLGGFDKEHCQQVAVQVEQYALDTSFVFEITQVAFGSYSRSGGFFGWQDVSFPFFGVPTTEYLELYNELNPTFNFDYGQLTLPCGSAGVDITLTINGVQLTVPGKNYIVDLGNPDGSCTLVLQAFDDRSFWLGVPFTTAFCAQVDISTNTVGFAPAREP